MPEEIDTRLFLLEYEISQSLLVDLFALIPSDWVNDRISDYYAWKVERKLRRWQKWHTEMEEFKARFAK